MFLGRLTYVVRCLTELSLLWYVEDKSISTYVVQPRFYTSNSDESIEKKKRQDSEGQEAKRREGRYSMINTRWPSYYDDDEGFLLLFSSLLSRGHSIVLTVRSYLGR